MVSPKVFRKPGWKLINWYHLKFIMELKKAIIWLFTIATNSSSAQTKSALGIVRPIAQTAPFPNVLSVDQMLIVLSKESIEIFGFHYLIVISSSFFGNKKNCIILKSWVSTDPRIAKLRTILSAHKLGPLIGREEKVSKIRPVIFLYNEILNK